MNNDMLEPLTFSVRLSLSAHKRADEKRRHQADPEKAQQIYLKTLAEYATEFYLKTVQVGDSESRSKLECVATTFDSELARIPSEALKKQLGIVVVQLDESLTEGTILGFADKVEAEELSLERLRAIDELPEYLLHPPETEPSQETQRESVLAENIKQWLEQMLQTGWRKIEDLSEALLPLEQEKEAYAQSAQIEADLQICKTIYLDDNKQEIGICINLTDRSDPTPKFDVLVEVFAPQISAKPKMFWSSQKFLPSGLEIFLIIPPDTICHHVKLSTKKQRVPLKKLTVFGGTQIEVKIESSKFNRIESFCIPD